MSSDMSDVAWDRRKSHCLSSSAAARAAALCWITASFAYEHPKYHHGSLEIRRKSEPVVLPDGRVLTVDVLRDGEVHASFENTTQARRWASKLGVVAPIAA